ncbi:MAG: FtsX-like permease family protein [Pseudomonadota bacterium]|nr:FtsX-like permease family protein [Pseudomonadota bacterium]
MKRSDIPFAADDAHAFLPWVVGIMAFLATLLLCLGLTMGGWIVDRHETYSSSFTVNIPDTGDASPDKITRVHDALQKLPGVAAIAQVSDGKLREMLKPWMGGGASLENLPLPVVFDVTLTRGAAVDYNALQQSLSAIAPGTEIDAHERWIASFSSFSAAAQLMLLMLSAFILGGLVLMIAFTSRAALKLHAKTVQLLHAIGAEDGYIAGQFQREAFLLTLRGAGPGCLLAVLLYWAAHNYMALLLSSLLPALSVNLRHLSLIVVMPLLCGAVAWLTSLVSVHKQLRQML